MTALAAPRLVRAHVGSAQLLVTAALVLLGVALRAPVFTYHGPAAPHPMNLYLSAHVGAYTDIAHLYFRDRLWQHPIPYVDFRFEYPVLTGAFVWLAATFGSSVGEYFIASAVLLTGLGVGAVAAVRRIDGANPWILAAAPALAFYGVLNWDLLGVCLLALALMLFQRKRDVPAALVLALATWAKLFPIVVLPIVLALRVADGRRRSALAIAGTFAAVTVAVNAPFALTLGRQGPLRDSWLYFFRFTQTRPPRATIWEPVLGHHADLVAVPLTVVGLAAILMLAVRTRSRPGGTLLPASVASLLWVFATAKVYSPQYAIWIFAALAIVGVPWRLVLGFALVDTLVFTTTFGPLYPGLPLHAMQWASDGLRQVVTAALAGWIVQRRLVGRPQRIYAVAGI